MTYRNKLLEGLKEANKHLEHLEFALEKLSRGYKLPLDDSNFARLIADDNAVMIADQMIYRFSKAQDVIGAKLFKLLLLAQGERVDRPFLDVLNLLEKWGVVNVDEWFKMRDIRNEIAHEYADDDKGVMDIINNVYSHKNALRKILDAVGKTKTR